MKRLKKFKRRLALVMSMAMLFTMGVGPGNISFAKELTEEEVKTSDIEDDASENLEVVTDVEVANETSVDETTEDIATPEDAVEEDDELPEEDGNSKDEIIYEGPLPAGFQWVYDAPEECFMDDLGMTKQEYVDSLFGITRLEDGTVLYCESMPMLMSAGTSGTNKWADVKWFMEANCMDVGYGVGGVCKQEDPPAGWNWSCAGFVNTVIYRHYDQSVGSYVNTASVYYLDLFLTDNANFTYVGGMSVPDGNSYYALCANGSIKPGDVLVFMKNGEYRHAAIAGDASPTGIASSPGVYYMYHALNDKYGTMCTTGGFYLNTTSNKDGDYVKVYRSKEDHTYVNVTKSLDSSVDKNKIKDGTRVDFKVEKWNGSSYETFGYINAYWHAGSKSWSIGYRKNAGDVPNNGGTYSTDKTLLTFDAGTWVRITEVRAVEPVTSNSDWNTLTGWNNYFKSDNTYNVSKNMTIDSVSQEKQLTEGGKTYNFTFTNGWTPWSKVKLKKVSNNTSVTNGNNCYDINGTTYTIYNDAACTKVATAYSDDYKTTKNAVLVCDSNGDSVAINMVAGTYYAKETKAGKGYALDPRVYPIVLTDAYENTPYVLNVSDKPQLDPVDILIMKKDADEPDKVKVQNAIFVIKFYPGEYADNVDPATLGKTPTKIWTFKSDENGQIKFRNDPKWFVSGSEFWLNSFGLPVLPLGTVTIQETSAPEDYICDSTVFVRKVTGAGTTEAVTTYNEPVITNKPKRQAFQIVKMGETATNEINPLANAGFMAANVNDLKKDADGNYIWDESKAINLCDINNTPDNYLDDTRELFTDKNGYAKSAKLRIGTYLVHESTVPKNYLPIKDFTVTITKDDPEPQEVRYFTDEIVKSYLKIVKLDGTTKLPILNTNKNVKFKLWSYDQNKYVSFKTYVDGKFVNIGEFVINNDGYVVTPGTIVAGSYRLEEYETLDNYYIKNESGQYDFTIDRDSVFEKYIDEEGNEADAPCFVINIENEQYYGMIEIDKVAEYYELNEDEYEKIDEPLEGIEFGIFASEDIYSQDGHRNLLYAKEQMLYTITTDKDGHAKSNMDLPIGNYYLKELNTPEEFEECDEVPFSISIDGEIIYKKLSDGSVEGTIVVDREIVNYKKIEMKTTATDKNTEIQNTNAAKDAVIVDEVFCKNLLIGHSYHLKGKLYDSETGEPLLVDGKEVTAEKDFIATEGVMTITMEFKFDATTLKGTQTVVFEDLYEGDRKVATHSDLTDKNQTIDFPEIKTTLLDEASSDHFSSAVEDVVLVDTVSYKRLIPGKKYVMLAVLMDKETGEPILSNALPIMAKTEFVPEEAEGTVEVVFKVDGRLLEGKTTVCFEKLTYENKELAIHADIEDEDQTVYFPEIKTSATDEKSGTHSSVYAHEITIVDRVTYKNLDVNKSYRVTGKLYNTETGNPILDADGNEVTREVVFTPEKPDGYVDVRFTFKADDLAGVKTVVFEDLYERDTKRHIATHSDLSDENQQVEIGYATLKITKIDGYSKKALSGVEFELYREMGATTSIDNNALASSISRELVGTYVTDENGEIYIDDLSFGKYYLVETKTLTGYKLPEGETEFVIDSAEEENTLTVENEGKEGTLTINPNPSNPGSGNSFGHFPRTGDNAKPFLVAIIMGIAAAALVVLSKKKSKKKVVSLAIAMAVGLGVVGTSITSEASAYQKETYFESQTENHDNENTIVEKYDDVDDCFVPDKEITQNGTTYVLDGFKLVPRYDKSTHLTYYDETDYVTSYPSHKDKVSYTYKNEITGEDIEYELPYSKTEIYDQQYNIPSEFKGTVVGYDAAYLVFGDVKFENPGDNLSLDQNMLEALLKSAGVDVSAYKLPSVSYTGEAYTNADGYLCRDYVIKAYSEGTKYRIYYEGDFDDIVVGYDCEATYVIKEQPTTEEITEATTEEIIPEPIVDEEPKKEKSFFQTTAGKVVLSSTIVLLCMIFAALGIYVVKGGRKDTDYRSRRDSRQDYKRLKK